MPALFLKLKTFVLAFIYNEFTSYTEGRLNKTQSQRRLYQALEVIQSSSENLMIMGDFNVHWELPNDKFKKKLSCWCASRDLEQVQKEPTRGDTILDLILARNIENVTGNYTLDELQTDHKATVIEIGKNKQTSRTITYKVLKDIDEETIKNFKNHVVDENGEINNEVRKLAMHLSALHEKLYTVRSFICSSKPKWYTKSLASLKMKIKHSEPTDHNKL